MGGEGSRALVSILALLPQKDYDEKKDKTTRLQDLSYYLSKDIQQIEDVERLSNKKAEEHQLNSAAVSHTCCALVTMQMFLNVIIVSNLFVLNFRPTLPQTVSDMSFNLGRTIY